MINESIHDLTDTSQSIGILITYKIILIDPYRSVSCKVFACLVNLPNSHLIRYGTIVILG